MADTKSPEERSKNMSAIKRADTKPEKYIRNLLFSSGYRYRLQTNVVPAHPDLWLRKYNTAVFIHGCFWHRHRCCKYAYIPKSRIEFWEEKIKKNELRDQIVQAQLAAHGIKCLIIWECTIKKVQKKTGNREQLLADIENFRNDYLQLTTKSPIKQKHICQMRHKLDQISTNIGQKMGQKSLIKRDNADNMYICSG